MCVRGVRERLEQHTVREILGYEYPPPERERIAVSVSCVQLLPYVPVCAREVVVDRSNLERVIQLGDYLVKSYNMARWPVVDVQLAAFVLEYSNTDIAFLSCLLYR